MTILIVDDDRIVVSMIEKTVDWEALDIDTVLTAYDGEQAKKRILEGAPDIVLCDIEMPVLDGMELLAWMQQERIRTYTVFLTCHEEFSLVQKALRLGAQDYIVKPLPEEELTETLKKAVQILRFRKRSEEENRSLKRFQYNQDYAYSEFVQQLFRSTVFTDRTVIGNEARRRDILFNADTRYRILSLGIRFPEAEEARMSRAETAFIFTNSAKETFFRDPSYPLCAEEEDKDTLYLFFLLPEESEADVPVCFQRLNNKIQQFFGVNVSGVLSDAVFCEDLSEEKKWVDTRNGTAMLQQKLLYGGRKENDGIRPAETLKDETLLEFLRKGEKSNFLHTVRTHTEHLRQEGKLTTTVLRSIHRQAEQAFYSYMREIGLDISGIFTEEQVILLDENADRSLFDLINYLNTLFDRCAERVSEAKREDSIIRNAISYIDIHYRENIHREDIAREIGVTPNYLSTRFSEVTGSGIRDYINVKRIREAMRLMTNTEASLGWIALEVGFQNATYFTRVFKKVMGVTPIEWKDEKSV